MRFVGSVAVSGTEDQSHNTGDTATIFPQVNNH